MANPYLGEIRRFGFNFAPKGWALCNGQVLAINQYSALFALLGTTYGGNGTTTFALPNLQGRAALHMGNTVTLGDQLGMDPSMPTTVNAVTSLSINRGMTSTPVGSVAVTPWADYANNRQPSLVVNFCIALQGIFPARN